MSLILPQTFASVAKATEDRPPLRGGAVRDIASVDQFGWFERISAWPPEMYCSQGAGKDLAKCVGKVGSRSAVAIHASIRMGVEVAAEALVEEMRQAYLCGDQLGWDVPPKRRHL